MHRSYTLVKFLKCFYTILNFQLLVASPEKCFSHVDLVFNDGPPTGLGQRLLSSASHKSGDWAPMTLSFSPGCHAAHLPLSSLPQGFLLRVLQPFISRYLFHVCHLTASYFHPCFMSTSQTRHPGERVSSWAHPPGAVISRLAACGSGSHAELCGSNRRQGTSKAVRLQAPVRTPALGDYRHCCSLQSKNSHFFKFLLMSGYPGRKVLSHH